MAYQPLKMVETNRSPKRDYLNEAARRQTFAFEVTEAVVAGVEINLGHKEVSWTHLEKTDVGRKSRVVSTKRLQ